MCGIFGFVSKNGTRPCLKTMQRIALVTERRGPHAFGFAWIDGSGRLRSFKQKGRISNSIDLLRMAVDARMLIGHTRYVTQGAPESNINNHPHPVDGGWLVHNGMIPSFRSIIDRFDLHPSSDCDSEVLGLLIEQLPGTLLERCKEAVAYAAERPLAMAALWRSPQRLIAIRAGNPLAIGQTENGWYFASSSDGLPDGKALRDGRVLSFTREGSGHKLALSDLDPELPLLTPPPPPAPAPKQKRATKPTQPRFPFQVTR